MFCLKRHKNAGNHINKDCSKNKHTYINIQWLANFSNITRCSLRCQILILQEIVLLRKSPGKYTGLFLRLCFYKDIRIFFFTLSGSSSSSKDILITKSTPLLWLIFSSFVITASTSALSKQAIFKKLSKYICCRS